MSTTEKIQMKLSDSKSARWTALFIVSVTMMFGYFFTDVMSPLEPLLTAAKALFTGQQLFVPPGLLCENKFISPV